eukprot:34584-Eustigmatos_ZCMA.PRE.1
MVCMNDLPLQDGWALYKRTALYDIEHQTKVMEKGLLLSQLDHARLPSIHTLMRGSPPSATEAHTTPRLRVIQA